MPSLSDFREKIRELHLADEQQVLSDLVKSYAPSIETRAQITEKSISLVKDIREDGNPGLMEVFLAEYGLSTDEGVALMCLAEALLRVPDAETIDELIEDKIAPSAWGEHLGQSSSPLVNASTWALMLTGKVLQEPSSNTLADTLHMAVRRLGEPVIRTAVKRAMKEMGHQFVLGQTISEAVKRGDGMQKLGFTYSYDMLGEAALTDRDAQTFYAAYEDAIKRLAKRATHEDIRDNPGISIKLSALHPRYEVSQQERVMRELVPRVKELALLAKNASMGLNIDAEEADRLDLSLDVIEAVFRSPELKGWDGFGVVVQAYGKRASSVIDWLHQLASEEDRQIMVRLVKGAYWDTEIKQAQVESTENFPVFTDKAATDISYICCAQQLLNYADRLYPQFATHNAHTVAAILNMADDGVAYEFQRLHGMGETLHTNVLQQEQTRCRIYAPVGAHSDLLAYLVRRLLENGANSSFVNQIIEPDVTPEEISSDPFALYENGRLGASESVISPEVLYGVGRKNSKGWDLRNYDDLSNYHAERDRFETHIWNAKPLVSGLKPAGDATPVFSPNDPDHQVGTVIEASDTDVDHALNIARAWNGASPQQRCDILNKAADLYEENSGEFFAALCREAGKTALDAIAEIREAVDFLRFYGTEAIRLGDAHARGLFTCISPWNFPLAIFTGQLSAALAAGNGVLAKPADPTPIIASIAVKLLHQAGVPKDVLQLVIGKGSVVGVKLTTDPSINGICFTGSTGVAQIINRNASQTLEPDFTFIAETGGLNAMIVDSTALPEQAIQDIVDSSFRSCGQRCSALRVLYLQEDIAEPFLEMLYGAMDELEVSHPWDMSSDVGPVITETARTEIINHIEKARIAGTLLKQMDAPDDGLFVGPAAIRVDGVLSLEKEIFGPVLHVAIFKSNEIDQIIHDINTSGYGLTFGLHTRIDDRVEYITSRLNVGNMYVNRNQIGAIVESQPFGGEGLSGTGPKAGGPLYVNRFKKLEKPELKTTAGNHADIAAVQSALNAARSQNHAPLETRDMPGPTGESNRWSTYPKGTILCLGPTIEAAKQQSEIANSMGCATVTVVPGVKGPNSVSGFLERNALTELTEFAAVALWSETADLLEARKALALRDGALLPLIATNKMEELCVLERHLCIDTTAAGGNASLLAAQ